MTAAVDDGDPVHLDVQTATIQNMRDGNTLTGSVLPDFVLDILAQGALLPKRGRRLHRGRPATMSR